MRPVLLFLALLILAMPVVAQGADTAPRQSSCGGMTNGHPDQDCDGTPDATDQCPTEPGVGGSGCPDPDGDGTYGANDKCPTQPGPPSNGGCPAAAPTGPTGPAGAGYADGDADGIPDSSDACPTVAGPNTATGCPDRDGDDVADSADACPDEGSIEHGLTKDGCPDGDRDGVADDRDKCTSSFADGRAVARAAAVSAVDADGCPPWEMQTTLLASTLGDLSDDPTVHVQCINTKGVNCTFNVTLTLSAASARKLHVPAKILDVTMKTNKKSAGIYLYTSRDAGFSKKVLRAFDRAVTKRLTVTMTLAGTFRLGSGKERSLGSKTFVMTRKDPSGAYRFSPGISANPDGPIKEKPKPESDF
ncbi:MAG: thrombospondin type 3 repeat-containing protein [Solirubrobacteraceae bacterium]